MTVIAAARVNNHIVMAADSQTTAGWEKLRDEEPKLWVADDTYLIGAAGSCRVSQILEHHTQWPTYRPNEDTNTTRFVVREIIPALRTALDGHGAVEVENGVEYANTWLLVAWADKLATIWGNWSVLVSAEHRAAIGSGGAEAVGYLGNAGPWTRRDVVTAARRATLTNTGCDGPIKYASTKTLTIKEA